MGGENIVGYRMKIRPVRLVERKGEEVPYRDTPSKRVAVVVVEEEGVILEVEGLLRDD
jgi:transposase